MATLLLALLHLFALILVVRLTLPDRFVMLNPYAAATGTLLARLLNFVRAGIRLPDKPLCAVLLVLSLAACAAALTRVGGPSLIVGGAAVVSFPAKGFLGWLGIAALDFVGFYIALLAGIFMLRLWHLWRPLPGYAGELLTLAGRPFTGLRLPAQAIVLLVLALLYVAVAFVCANGVQYPLFEMVEQMGANLPGGQTMPAFLHVQEHPAFLQTILLAGMTVLNVLGQIRDYIFLFWLILALAALMGAAPMAYFLRDVLRLLCGRIPPLRLGPIDLSPLVAVAALAVVHGVLGGLFLLFIGLLAHVV